MKDGWMTCDFTSFSTVFQSYQGIGQMIKEGCVQWNPISIEKVPSSHKAQAQERQISRPELDILGYWGSDK